MWSEARWAIEIAQTRTGWWTEDVHAAVAEKKAAYRAWIGWQRVENR